MRLGEIIGDKMASKRGEILNNWLDDKYYLIKPFAKCEFTFEAASANGKFRHSIIDMAYVSDQAFTHTSLVKVWEDSYGSDHKPISIEIELLQPIATEPKRIAFDKLKNPAKAAKYKELVEPELLSITKKTRTNWLKIKEKGFTTRRELQDLADSMDSQLTNAMMEAAAQVCKYRRPYSAKGFLTDPEITDLKKERSRLLKKLSLLDKTTITSTSTTLRAMISCINKRIKNRVIELRRARWNEFLGKVEEAEPAEKLRMISKALRGNTRPPNNLTIEDILPCHAHFAKAFSHIEGVDYSDVEFNYESEEFIEVREESEELNRLLEMSLSETSFQVAIQKAPNGKAPGISGLANEALKPVAKPLSKALTLIGEVAARAGIIPSSWHLAALCLVPKKPGACTPADHRPISLTETMRGYSKGPS